MKSCPYCGDRLEFYKNESETRCGWDKEYYTHNINPQCFLAHSGAINIYPHMYEMWNIWHTQKAQKHSCSFGEVCGVCEKCTSALGQGATKKEIKIPKHGSIVGFRTEYKFNDNN